MSSTEESGPLAQQFATLRVARGIQFSSSAARKRYYDGLSVIERHVQAMETALATARKTLEVIEEPMHFDDLEAIADDRVRMQAAARAWLERDRAALPASRTSGEKGTD